MLLCECELEVKNSQQEPMTAHSWHLADTYPGFAIRITVLYLNTAFFFSFTTFQQAISKHNTLFYTETTYHSLKFIKFPRKSYKFKFNCNPAGQEVPNVLSLISLVSRSLPNTVTSRLQAEFKAEWERTRTNSRSETFPQKNAGFQCFCQALVLFICTELVFVCLNDKRRREILDVAKWPSQSAVVEDLCLKNFV